MKLEASAATRRDHSHIASDDRGADPGERSRVRLKTILAPVDFSNLSLAGMRYALRLGAAVKASVSLVHVVRPAPQFTGLESSLVLPSDSELLKLAEQQLRRIARKESRKGVVLKSRVRFGQPFQEISMLARNLGADLIVLATHGYSGVRHAVLGSTAERVVRHAPCAVLAVRSSARSLTAPPFRLKRILVPIDLSELSKQALPWAAFMAAAFRAEVILFHVTEKLPIDYLLGPELMNHAITPLMKQAEAELERIAAALRRFNRIKISVAVRDGTAYKQICDTARAREADLIVSTTHGYTGLKHIWMGSTAERIVRHAHCPVLIVRPKSGTQPQKGRIRAY